MSERLPNEVFTGPTLSEAPRVIPQRPDRNTVLETYNTVFDRFMDRRNALMTRYTAGEFAPLGTISDKIRNSQPLTPAERALVVDYGMLLDAEAAFHGRRNLNAADVVTDINRRNREDLPLSAQDRTHREAYQAGNFHEFTGIIVAHHPLRNHISSDRYVVPVRDGDRSFDFFDGAPVEGMIRFLDQEMQEAMAGTLPAWEQNRIADERRRERDILFTSSSVLIEDDTLPSAHARKQYESYMHSIDDMRKEWILPDWLNAENVLRERRILNLPDQRGSRRLGCPILLLPIPFLLLVPICTTVNSPCVGTGGQLGVEGFSRNEASAHSVDGAIQREMAYHRLGISQSEYRPAGDLAVVIERDRLRDDEPTYFKRFSSERMEDYVQTAQRLRGDTQPSPWVSRESGVPVRNFHDESALVSCLSTDQVDQRAKQAVDREQNPQWWHGLEEAWQGFQRVLPKWQTSRSN